jgi:hypothetical protein
MAQGNHCFEPERHVIALFGLSYSRFVLAEAREGSFQTEKSSFASCCNSSIRNCGSIKWNFAILS